ncbi:hypothetical protein EJF36_11140 [Bacillus sp. HMF5848]|uniref:YpoC family protein n=1 Tax=Bacillus sp. HMF5848 TaxID=2495421 RepID=UPI000F77793F|nr:hypothetical protein [Bacillus sp. HMF5848]RSK27394.1 hypothetical protein EJF36_11140 [Bacillus sp. HMF5848]
MKTNMIKVPAPFIHPLFYNEGDSIYIPTSASIESILQEGYFVYDIAAFLNISLEKPWTYFAASSKQVLKTWNDDKLLLHDSFSKRDKQAALPIMKRASQYALCYLFWLNGTYVENVRELEDALHLLSVKPINIVDRFSYILNKPEQYHSFIQLTEIMNELEKLYYKQQAMKQT